MADPIIVPTTIAVACGRRMARRSCGLLLLVIFGEDASQFPRPPDSLGPEFNFTLSFITGVPEKTGKPSLSIRKEWLGPESNQRHMDFQSTALPTELPSLDFPGKISSLSRRKATA